jgi:nucleoside-diphosphate kinase
MPEQTLLLIKPNATQKKVIGKIISIIEEHGFNILKLRSFFFDLELVTAFYAEHIGKEFFTRLTDFMMSGMIVGLLLEKEDAVHELRELIGSTEPSTRKPDTIRALYADSYNQNAVHASDSHDHALYEIKLIFPADIS